jgi:hypothetical protein
MMDYKCGAFSLAMSMYKIAEENMDLKMRCPKCGYADRMMVFCGIAQNYRNVRRMWKKACE